MHKNFEDGNLATVGWRYWSKSTCGLTTSPTSPRIITFWGRFSFLVSVYSGLYIYRTMESPSECLSNDRAGPTNLEKVLRRAKQCQDFDCQMTTIGPQNSLSDSRCLDSSWRLFSLWGDSSWPGVNHPAVWVHLTASGNLETLESIRIRNAISGLSTMEC